jgi:hypothetical protein
LKTKTWDTISSANKVKIISIWNSYPEILQTKLLQDEDPVVAEEDVVRKSNWNKHDWGRLIHIFHCPELQPALIEFLQVNFTFYHHLLVIERALCP